MYEDLIQEFILAQEATSPAEINRYNKQLKIATDLITEMQLAEPNQEYYSELEKRFEKTQKSLTTRSKSINRVRNFWEFKKDKEKQIDMFDDGEILEATGVECNNSAPVTVEDSNIPVSDTQEDSQLVEVTSPSETDTQKKSQPQKQRGRPKRFETGYKKLTLYFEPETFKLIKAISNAKNISMSEYAVNILEQDLAKKKSVIEQLIALQESL